MGVLRGEASKKLAGHRAVRHFVASAARALVHRMVAAKHIVLASALLSFVLLFLNLPSGVRSIRPRTET